MVGSSSKNTVKIREVNKNSNAFDRSEMCPREITIKYRNVLIHIDSMSAEV